LQNQINDLQNKLLDTQMTKRQATTTTPEPQRKTKRSKVQSGLEKLSKESDVDCIYNTYRVQVFIELDVVRMLKHTNDSNVEDIISCLSRHSIQGSILCSGIQSFIQAKQTTYGFSEDALLSLLWFTLSREKVSFTCRSVLIVGVIGQLP
jgi:hypothetical protein